ncbi:amino acid/amide ABC transporter ATP-binding protein 1 (HAAT family) [Antricoccus suffuscus]|uniref:Amino acid/amide ABC transporter ATP-binding protein 1 (HAAT family) n=1 Tax=Antricoccus suffuscus TaxID=1629062 RepID=A0A2T0ZJZ4_9ACTN|nr:amino acid/amide ABC transporter ATP-binding protein 1 (HAAT family) [Antricoccus suffuscus]
MTKPATSERNVSTSSQPAVERTPPPPLILENATVRFGGIVALNDVSFTVEPGTIHAVIGPNGAGKSTCFNAITGVYKLASGKITLGDTVLSNTPPHKIARLGLGRAFQNLALSGTSTVLDNVMLGRHSLMKGGFASYGLRLPWVIKTENRHLQRAAEICDFLGISQHLHKPAGLLSYGDQKRVDIARALASEPKVLMLDEPAAGMNSTETAEIAQLIHDVRDELRISILLVEHDMSLVMDVADHVTVLDFGKRIADDVPSAVQKDPAVIRAYLGAPEDEVNAETSADQPKHAAGDGQLPSLDDNGASEAAKSEDSQ